MLLTALLMPNVEAAWSGMSLSIDELEDDWKFENEIRLSDTTRLNLHFEEKTVNGILVGANIGRLTTRISNKSGPANTEKFDASFIGLYLGYPFYLSEQLILHNRLGYQYHSGSRSVSTEEDKISWREASYLLGLSYRVSDLRIMPFITVSDISGDLERELNTDTFENDESISTGISLDLFVDPTSFIRLQYSQGSGHSFSIRFAREY